MMETSVYVLVVSKKVNGLWPYSAALSYLLQSYLKISGEQRTILCQEGDKLTLYSSLLGGHLGCLNLWVGDYRSVIGSRAWVSIVSMWQVVMEPEPLRQP